MMKNETKLIYGKHVKNAFISILIPTVRINNLALEALNSALNQSKVEVPYEIILLINNPNFKEYDLLPKDERLVIYQNTTQLSMRANIKHCADLSNAKYISYLHDDDLLLNNFIYEITRVLKDKHFNCLIPERYLLYSDSEFGKKLRNKARKKEKLSKLLFFRFFYRKKLHKIELQHIYRSLENCYGAPSCGITFDREIFIDTDGFNSDSKYAFDFDYLLRLNADYDIYVLRKKLGIYRMIDSATNKPEVQLDFFNYWMEYISKSNNKYISKHKNNIIKCLYDIRDDNAKKLITNSGYLIPDTNKISYKIYRINRVLYKYIHNLDINFVK